VNDSFHRRPSQHSKPSLTCQGQTLFFSATTPSYFPSRHPATPAPIASNTSSRASPVPRFFSPPVPPLPHPCIAFFPASMPLVAMLACNGSTNRGASPCLDAAAERGKEEEDLDKLRNALLGEITNSYTYSTYSPSTDEKSCNAARSGAWIRITNFTYKTSDTNRSHKPVSKVTDGHSIKSYFSICLR
jgi:hypothetical protein